MCSAGQETVLEPWICLRSAATGDQQCAWQANSTILPKSLMSSVGEWQVSVASMDSDVVTLVIAETADCTLLCSTLICE